MDGSGPHVISPLNVLSKPEARLHPFQRVTAQILNVMETTALLSVDGYPIVAQLTSADQAAALLSQTTAQFIVTQLTPQKITLRLVNHDSSETITASPSTAGTELARRVLEQYRIPATVNNLIIARSVLKQHLPITNDLLNELMETLSAYGSWGSKEANLATTLKAAGLPVTTQSIGLALRQTTQTGQKISHLIKLLNGLASPDLSPELLKQLELNTWLLNGLILDGDEEPSGLTEQLKAALEILGRSLENTLLEGLQDSKSASSQIGLTSLARLQKMLEQAGKHEVADSIGNFLEDLQANQFLNANPEWLNINFAIQNCKAGEEFLAARLRIAKDTKLNPRKIDPAFTTLILQVDISPHETVEVNLSIKGEKIQTSLTGPNALWCQQAEEELPCLEQALERLGFTVQDSKVGVGEAGRWRTLDVTSDSIHLAAVDIEA